MFPRTASSGVPTRARLRGREILHSRTRIFQSSRSYLLSLSSTSLRTQCCLVFSPTTWAAIALPAVVLQPFLDTIRSEDVAAALHVVVSLIGSLWWQPTAITVEVCVQRPPDSDAWRRDSRSRLRRRVSSSSGRVHYLTALAGGPWRTTSLSA